LLTLRATSRSHISQAIACVLKLSGAILVDVFQDPARCLILIFIVWLHATDGDAQSLWRSTTGQL